MSIEYDVDKRECRNTPLETEIAQNKDIKATDNHSLPGKPIGLQNQASLISENTGTGLKWHMSQNIIRPEMDDSESQGPGQVDIIKHKMTEQSNESDPLFLWTSIRPWAALNISCWDFLCDKAKWAEYPGNCKKGDDRYSLKSKAYKIQVSESKKLNWEHRFVKI